MVTASLQNYRISPRKVRVVADMIRGKGVMEAKTILAHAAKKARHPIADLIDSAVANASNNHQLAKDTLFIKEIRVDQGYVLKRHKPVSRGSAHPIKHRTSHVSIVLATREQSKSPESKGQKSGKKAASK